MPLLPISHFGILPLVILASLSGMSSTPPWWLALLEDSPCSQVMPLLLIVVGTKADCVQLLSTCFVNPSTVWTVHKIGSFHYCCW